jgi:hypothetical protein
VSVEDNSNSADDGSTIVDVEETNAEETTVGVQDADDVIVSDGPVEHNEVNTEVTNIDDTDTTIIAMGMKKLQCMVQLQFQILITPTNLIIQLIIHQQKLRPYRMYSKHRQLE